MSTEQHAPQQKNKQEPLQQNQHKYQQSSHAVTSHPNTQKRHHEQCSYDKDIVCDHSDLHQHRPTVQLKQKHHHSEHGNHTSAANTSAATASTTKPHCQRKHSHSPHHSHQASPHSHRSHSLHSSPNQSHLHMHLHNYESPTTVRAPSTVNATGTTIDSSSGIMRSQTSGQANSHHPNHRRRRRQSNHHTANGKATNENITTDGLSTSHQKRSALKHNITCSRRHRSNTDVSSTSLNNGHDLLCADHEVREILVRKSCCNSSSRTELAQYFAEDLYGTSRRPSSCCTSSDYCYQTDSTSLYGSRSSLSRNNSIKSASVLVRTRRTPQRQPSYTSISLRALNASCPNSQLGSLTSMFERAKSYEIRTADMKPRLGVAKSAELHRQTSKDALSSDLPEYACSPSPIRWSFLADSKSSTEFDAVEMLTEAEPKESKKNVENKKEARRYRTGSAPRERTVRRENDDEQVFEGDQSKEKGMVSQALQPVYRRSTLQSSGCPTSVLEDQPSTSAAAAARKTHEKSFISECEESSTTVLFHQEGEAYNNCCSNYIQCNTYLDQDLQITSEDIHQYLSKGNQHNVGDVLNNSKNYPFQPSNALEFQYKNNFANNNKSFVNTTGADGGNAVGGFSSGGGCGGTTTASSEGGDSVSAYDGMFRRNSSKETNLNQQNLQPTPAVPCTSTNCTKTTPLSLANINLSSSTDNINIVFNSVSGGIMSTEHSGNEVKFINTGRSDTVVSSEAHHSGYLPYTYPTYDYTNMSANPHNISELPQPSQATAMSIMCSDQFGEQCSAYETDHSASHHSPIPTGISFESFDAASENNLLSQRGSVQYSSPLSTVRSPLSPASTASINPAADSFVQPYHEHLSLASGDAIFSHFKQKSLNDQFVGATGRHFNEDDDYNYYESENSKDSCFYHHDTSVSGVNAESFKLAGAIKKVRKRARKYTNFLRKNK